MNKKAITFVTSNINKYNEVKEMIPDINIIQKDIPLVEIQEKHEEIVRQKCGLAAYKLNEPVLIEDTSLEFNALNGLPGPYIKHFVKKISSQGLYDLLEKYEDKSARAVCYLAYTEGPGKMIHMFKGVLEGTIVPPRNVTDSEGKEETCFDWDNIFVPSGSTQTFSEMGKEKNEISHRRKSVNMFAQFIVSKCIENLSDK